MTTTFCFRVPGASGQSLPVSVIRLDDAEDAYLLCGPDDVGQDGYTVELTEVTTLAPLPLEDVLGLAADLGCSSMPVPVS